MENAKTDEQLKSERLKTEVVLPTLLKIYKLQRRTVDEIIEDANKLLSFIESNPK